MEEKLIKIEVNLQQSIIWTGREGVSNAICAITHRHRKVVVIRPEYRQIQKEILDMVGFQGPHVMYGDSFEVDTWDNRVERYLKKCVIEEEVVDVIDEAVAEIFASDREKIAAAVSQYISNR